MASKVSALIEATSIAATDLFYGVIGGASRRIKAENVFASLTGSKTLISYASLSAAVTAIGASQATLWITGSTTVAATLSVPSNITLLFMGTGLISVSSGQTLTINGPLVAEGRQIFTGAGVVRWGGQMTWVSPRWWGASLDGVADDTAEIQAAIDSFGQTNSPHAAGDVAIDGAAIISSSLTIIGKAVRIIGAGWGTSSEAPKGGYIKWNGSAGSPMILIQDSWNAGVENIRLIGKSTAKPSAGIEYRRSVGNTLQHHGYARQVYIGPMFGYDSDNAVQFDAGILISGTVDADTNHFEEIRIEKCTIGVDIQNGNASLTHFDTLKVTACSVGFKCNTDVIGTNWNFGGNTLDYEVLSGRILMIKKSYSEGSVQWATVASGGSLLIEGGGWEVTNSIIASGYVIDADQATHVELKNGHFAIGPGYTFSPLFKVRVRNSAGGAGFQYLSIDNMRGLGENQIDVTGPASTQHRTIVKFTRPPGPPFDVGANALNLLTGTQAFNEKQFDIGGALNVLGGPVKIKPIAVPAGLTVAATGGTGTTYSYRVSAITAEGETLASSAATVSGGATLSASVYNILTWNPVIGATGYKIYGRIGGSELLMGTRYAYDIHTKPDGATLTSFKDDGSVTPSGALPTTHSTAALKVFNSDDGAGNSEFTELRYSSNVVTLRSTSSGSGTLRALKIDAPDMAFRISGADKWGIYIDGMLYPATDNTTDLGAGSFRVRDAYFSRGMVIGGTSINSKAVLELSSTTKGFLPPRMTTTERDAITSPPAGLMIFNTTA